MRILRYSIPAALVITAAVVSLLLVSCIRHHENPIADMNLNVATIALNSDGQWSQTHGMPSSASADKLRSYLISLDDQWQSSMVSYAPYIVIQSEHDKILIQKQIIVVNARDQDGNPSQKTRQLTESEYEKLRELIDQLDVNISQ